jgi:hypothetical protein
LAASVYAASVASRGINVIPTVVKSEGVICVTRKLVERTIKLIDAPKLAAINTTRLREPTVVDQLVELAGRHADVQSSLLPS